MYPSGLPHITTRSITPRTGVRLRVLESGPPDGCPVVLIHGWGACVFTFRHTIEALVAANHRVVAFDLRGHGLSEKPAAPDDYRTDALLDDLVSVLDECSLDQPDLIGHSLGGGIALHFALRNPQRVRRLVLAAPVGLTSIPLRRIACLLTPRFTTRFARALTPRFLTSFLIRGAYGDPRQVTDYVIEQYWAPSQFPNYYRATRGLLHRFDWRVLESAELDRIRASTLVILGGADRLIRGAERGAREIPGAIIVNLQGAGHLGIEECPDIFKAELLRFLSSR
jgi:pimeloyl-ACP methyl ester carboxylesterase